MYNNSQYSLYYLLSIYSAFIDRKIVHKCWLLCKIPHLFSWENITRNIFCLCAKTKDSIDSDTISNIRIIYRMCREGDKLADSCLKQTTLFDDIVSRCTPLSYFFFVFEDSIIIWFSLFTEFAGVWCIYFFLSVNFLHRAFAEPREMMLSKYLHPSITSNQGDKNASKRKAQSEF